MEEPYEYQRIDPSARSVVMTIHYHGTPISPLKVLHLMAGSHFCVSYARPEQLRHCKQIGQSVMLDNGAFSLYRSGQAPDWPGYYAWVDASANRHHDWAVIPDVIDGTEAENDALLLQSAFTSKKPTRTHKTLRVNEWQEATD